MATKAGLAGILSGILALPFLVYFNVMDSSWPWGLVAIGAAVLVMMEGSGAAVHWSGSVEPARCAALGALAGGLAGVLVFCWIGAAEAGRVVLVHDARSAGMELPAAVLNLTQTHFLIYFLTGAGLGALRGFRLTKNKKTDRFDKSAPQMALNASITALPACVIAASVAAAIFSHLDGSLPDVSLASALLLVLIAHVAIALVVPHEARQAEHRSGMDEVKMAAYVGIGAAPVLALLLFLADRALFARSMTIPALLLSAGLSLSLLHCLNHEILPRRAAFPTPQNTQEQAQAALFGSIAESRAPRLVVLCIGCGMMMVLPFQAMIIAPLINLTSLLAAGSRSTMATDHFARSLFLTQFLVSTGLMVTASAILIGIYMLYLNLGRWFKRRVSSRTGAWPG